MNLYRSSSALAIAARMSSLIAEHGKTAFTGSRSSRSISNFSRSSRSGAAAIRRALASALSSGSWLGHSTATNRDRVPLARTLYAAVMQSYPPYSLKSNVHGPGVCFVFIINLLRIPPPVQAGRRSERVLMFMGVSDRVVHCVSGGADHPVFMLLGLTGSSGLGDETEKSFGSHVVGLTYRVGLDLDCSVV